MSDEIPSILYHYTTEKALQQILSSKELRPSLHRSRPNDVRFGEGQYLTDVLPGTKTNAQLSRLLLGQPFEGHRFTHYLATDVTGLTVQRGRRGVFVIPNTRSLDITGRIIKAGNNSDDLHQSAVDSSIRG